VFFDRCEKHRYIPHSIDIHDLLEKQDKKYALKVMGLEGHLLYDMLQGVKNTRQWQIQGRGPGTPLIFRPN